MSGLEGCSVNLRNHVGLLGLFKAPPVGSRWPFGRAGEARLGKSFCELNELSYSAASTGLVSLSLDAGRSKVSGITKK
jgi:hypothetical protein